MKLLGMNIENMRFLEDSAITAFHDQLRDQRGQSLYLFHARSYEYDVIPSYVLNNVKDAIEKFVNYVMNTDKGKGLKYVISVRSITDSGEEFEFYITIELLYNMSINYYPQVLLLKQNGDEIYNITDIKKYIEEAMLYINNRYMMNLMGCKSNLPATDLAFYAKNTSIEISKKRIYGDIANAVNDGKSGCKILSCRDRRWVSKTLLKELLRCNFNIIINEPDIFVTWEKYKGKILQYNYDSQDGQANYFETTFERLTQILEKSIYTISVVD